METRQTNILVKTLLAHQSETVPRTIDWKFEKYFKNNFPAKSKYDIIKLELDLKDTTFKINMAKRLSSCGGLNEKMLCLRILDVLH